MRAMLIAVAAVGLGLGSAGPVWAGLYNTTEPAEGPAPDTAGVVKPLPARAFRSTLSDLLLLGLESSNSEHRQKMVAQRDELLQKEARGELTVNDRVNLGADLIRLGQMSQAVGVLRQATREDPRNFMAAANLATASQLMGDWATAKYALKDILEMWPKQWPGLSEKQLDWYRRVEDYQLKLITLRAKEAAQAAQGQPKPTDHVDDLFGVRFVGESGQYEAGKLAAAEQQKLPPDAVAIVQQLLIWMPQDTRLYWLLGELLNAHGQINDAADVFVDCEDSRRYNAPELREHHQIVNDAVRAAAAQNNISPTSWLPDTRQTLVVGGTAGLIILGLAYLQIRELRRRRHGTSMSKGC